MRNRRRARARGRVFSLASYARLIRMARRFAFFVFLLLFVSAAEAQQKVSIGIVTALTGPLAAPGKFQLNGFRLAEEEINQAGGVSVGGRKYLVELKVYDTRANAAEGASAMQRLASVDNVPVVLGEVLAGAAAAEAPIAQDNGLPFILTVSTAPNLTEQGNRYLFRVNEHNDHLTDQLSDYVAKKS